MNQTKPKSIPLAELLEKVSKLPWVCVAHDDTDAAIEKSRAPYMLDEEDGYRLAYVLGDVPELNAKANAAYLTHAANNLPALVEALREALAIADEVRSLGLRYDLRFKRAQQALASAEMVEV